MDSISVMRIYERNKMDLFHQNALFQPELTQATHFQAYFQAFYVSHVTFSK